MTLLENQVFREKIYDTEIIRVTFREIIRGCVVLATLATVAHAGVFFAAEDTAWRWCVLIALGTLALFPLTGPRIIFPVFLATTLVVLASTLVYVTQMTWYVGQEAGFAYLLLVAIPVVMVSGRVDLIFKWVLSLLLFVYILVLDSGDALAAAMGPHAQNIDAIFHLVNLGIVALALGLGAYKYFVVTSDYQSVLRRQASTDPLTGLLNRRRLQEVAEQHVAKARRFRTPLSIVMGDVDFFKAVNDAHGHDAGDAVLRQVASQMQGLLREYDCACRWGGEEFLLVLPETDADQAVVIAQRIRFLVESTSVVLSCRKLAVTMTFGVAALAADETLEQCIHRADVALYDGKSNGRNQVSLAANASPQTSFR